MESLEQVIDGLIRYIKRELIPILPGPAKVLGGAALLHNASRLPEIVSGLVATDAAKQIGVVEADGRIDVDIWAQNLKEAMQEYSGGKLEIKLPMLQPIYISAPDVDTLRRYIKGELS